MSDLLKFDDGSWLQRGFFGAVVADDRPATPADLEALGYIQVAPSMKTVDNMGDLPARQDCDHPSGIGVSEADGYRPLTWQEAYEREREAKGALQKLATIVYDLDRCEHGRHEGDHCSACKGPSRGNPHLNPDRVIGYRLEGEPIRVPERGQGWDV